MPQTYWGNIPSTARCIASLLAVLALAVCAIAAPSGTAASAAVTAGDCTAGSDWGTLRGDLAGSVVNLVNAHRAARGLSQLAVSPTLQASAVWKARHMAQYSYMSHEDPAPPAARSTADRMATCGYSGGGWGENIAYGYPSPESVFNGWLNSPGHRTNIENPIWTAIGVGVASSRSGPLYWAQTFGLNTGGAAPAPPPPPAATPAPAPAPQPQQQPQQPPRQPHAQTPRPGAQRKSARPAVARAPKLVARAFRPLRGRPRLGRRFSGVVRFVKRGVKAPPARVRCRGFIGGQRLRVIWRGFESGVAGCVWRVPRAARGRLVWGSVRVKSRGRVAGRSFYMRMRAKR